MQRCLSTFSRGEIRTPLRAAVPDWALVSWMERPWDPDGINATYRAIFDDKGRMMVIICSNTDLGDGWEREGENVDYFHEFSEKKSYPMGINIVTYAMTH